MGVRFCVEDTGTGWDGSIACLRSSGSMQILKGISECALGLMARRDCYIPGSIREVVGVLCNPDISYTDFLAYRKTRRVIP